MSRARARVRTGSSRSSRQWVSPLEETPDSVASRWRGENTRTSPTGSASTSMVYSTPSRHSCTTACST
jgi:hypothetical protein